MASITVYFKDGTKKDFPETSRSGGSWCTSYTVKEGWVIIVDAYGTESMFPSEVVKEVKVHNTGRW